MRAGKTALTRILLAGVCAGIMACPADAQPAASRPQARPAEAGRLEWVTLGTQGGPIPSRERHEPANLLVRTSEAHLIDAGDGAATGLIAAGAQLPWLRTIFISHIHFDHIGGLFGVLGLRLQTRTVTPLIIYGPPGTKQIVAGLVEAMRPSAQSGFGVPGEVPIAPDANLTVVELTDGSSVQVGDMRVRAVANTHYSFAQGSPEAKRFQSLSFRFDLPERSIVYTGDTGPSPAVEALAKNADLLVTEMIDTRFTIENLRRRAAQMSPTVFDQMSQHLRTHHLTTDEIGQMVRRAGVRSVVITHLAGGAAQGGGAPDYAAEVARYFSGKVVVANDLDRF